MENKICAITEASDKFFHFTRTSIYSFVQHNKWFDGTIKLLVHQDLPLSEKNLLILRILYPKIEIISISSDFLNKIEGFDKIKKSPKYLELLSSYMKMVLFLLNPKKTLYFSNTCLFLNEISDFLISNKIISNSSFSLAYLDSDLPIIKKITVGQTSQFLKNVSIDSIFFDSIDSHCVISSNIPNTKFNAYFSRIQKSKFIVYDSSNNSANYSKITQIWLQKNHEISKYLQKSSNIQVSTIVERKNINSLNLVPTVRQVQPHTELIDLSVLSNYFNNKKIAIVANSSELLNYSYGKLIDSHDIIIRFNGYVTSPNHTGTKTNIHCIFREARFNLTNASDYLIVFSKPLVPWKNSVSELTKQYPSKKIINYNFPKDEDVSSRFGKVTIPTSGLCSIILIESLNLSKYELTLFGFNGYSGGVSSILRSNDSSSISSVHDYSTETNYLTKKFTQIFPGVLQKSKL
jgi:hypothetical protein